MEISYDPRNKDKKEICVAVAIRCTSTPFPGGTRTSWFEVHSQGAVVGFDIDEAKKVVEQLSEQIYAYESGQLNDWVNQIRDGGSFSERD
jgi:hypothetical protein